MIKFWKSPIGKEIRINLFGYLIKISIQNNQSNEE